MELSRTINSDKRYYLDENTIENTASFLQTMRVFNDAKIDLYNALYDQKYLASGPLIDHAYPVFLKEKYKTNDYYNAAIYTAASGSISSQKELKKYYGTTITADLKTRDEKIQMIQEALDKKKAVKNSIRIYRKDGRWITPYPRCQLKVKGLMIVLFNKTIVKLDEYERSVEADIRKLKTRLALVTEARKRKEKKLENDIKIWGQVDEITYNTLYNQADIFAFINIDQSWGLTVFEAMSAGIPTLVSNSVGAIELLHNGEDAIIVEPKDVREIADQMIALMEDGEYYNRISEKAYNAVKDYTWEKLYSSKMVKLFDELLRK